jgi:hypothetical protein
VPEGQFCNKPHKIGCRFLVGVSNICRCYCSLFETHLDNVSGDYCKCDNRVCNINKKCEQCLSCINSDEDINLEGFI